MVVLLAGYGAWHARRGCGALLSTAAKRTNPIAVGGSMWWLVTTEALHINTFPESRPASAPGNVLSRVHAHTHTAQSLVHTHNHKTFTNEYVWFLYSIIRRATAECF